MYRIETARARPQRRTLMTLLDLYGAEDSLRKDLLAISRSADDQGWLRPYHSALPEEYTAYISFEAEARFVRNYESLFIPGLLQTEDYARAVITGVLPGATPDQVAQRVQARMERQQLLDRASPLELWAVIDEAAIRRLTGGRDIMHALVTHLADAAARPNITIQVIPFEAGAHPGMPGRSSTWTSRTRSTPNSSTSTPWPETCSSKPTPTCAATGRCSTTSAPRPSATQTSDLLDPPPQP